ncbi:MAG: transcriptional repressor [Chloroflexi bacterium]|nr:transcriptional repressor [Chloroflexota bacterium]
MARPAHRLTPQRQAILEVIQASDNHPTAAQIYALVKGKQPRVAFGTVYKALDLLSRTGQILQLEFGDAASRYDRRTDRHDHAICTGCGRLVDLDVELPRELEGQASKASGFSILQHTTHFFGLCPTCQTGGTATLPSVHRE